MTLPTQTIKIDCVKEFHSVEENELILTNEAPTEEFLPGINGKISFFILSNAEEEER